MIEMQQLQLPEIVPQEDLLAWRAGLPKPMADSCPQEVREFIDAVAQKMPDFEQFQKESVAITGHELMLCGMDEMDGEKIRAGYIYELPMPRMIAVDHHSAMHRMFRKKGKQGLIDFIKAKVEGSRIARLLELLNVHVFHEERPEFRKVMEEIMNTPKITLAEARRQVLEIRRTHK